MNRLEFLRKIVEKEGGTLSEQMNYGEDYKFIPVTSVMSGLGQEVTPDIYFNNPSR